MNKEIILKVIGIFFIFFSVFALLNSIYFENPVGMLWFCYVNLFLMGVAIIYKKDKLLVAQICIVTIPFLFWSIDFFHWLIFDSALWGITDYFFGDFAFTSKIISLQHLFTLPLAFYCLYLIKIKKTGAWKISFLEMAILFFLSRLIASENANINYVYHAQDIPISLTGIYEFDWFIAVFIMISGVYFVLMGLNFLKSKNFIEK